MDLVNTKRSKATVIKTIPNHPAARLPHILETILYQALLSFLFLNNFTFVGFTFILVAQTHVVHRE